MYQESLVSLNVQSRDCSANLFCLLMIDFSRFKTTMLVFTLSFVTNSVPLTSKSVTNYIYIYIYIYIYSYCTYFFLRKLFYIIYYYNFVYLAHVYLYVLLIKVNNVTAHLKRTCLSCIREFT